MDDLGFYTKMIVCYMSCVLYYIICVCGRRCIFIHLSFQSTHILACLLCEIYYYLIHTQIRTYIYKQLVASILYIHNALYCMYVCMYVCMHACMYVCMYIYVVFYTVYITLYNYLYIYITITMSRYMLLFVYYHVLYG